MRALDPQVKEAVWQAIEPLIPAPADTHALGRHRQRKSDRLVFEVILVRLVTGCSWEDAERICQNKVSDTTVRSRRDEWIAAGVFETIVTEALSAYDKVIGLRRPPLRASARRRLRRTAPLSPGRRRLRHRRTSPKVGV
jgi:transposase